MSEVGADVDVEAEEAQRAIRSGREGSDDVAVSVWRPRLRSANLRVLVPVACQGSTRTRSAAAKPLFLAAGLAETPTSTSTSTSPSSSFRRDVLTPRPRLRALQV